MALQQASPKKIYIRVNENTISYFPFSSDATDQYGNNILTNSGTQDWLGRKFTSASNITTPSWTIGYVNYRIKINVYPSSNCAICLSNQKGFGYYPYHSQPEFNKKIFVWYDSSFSYQSAGFAPTVWEWHNISYGYDWTKIIYSIDGVGWTLYNWDGYNFGNTFIVSQGWDVTISKLWLTETARSSAEILNYYNDTKWDYWIS